MNLGIVDLGGPYFVAKLDPASTDRELICAQSYDGDFVSICTTSDEISIVCLQSKQNAELLTGKADIESGWSLIRVDGQLEFEMVGVIAKFSSILADARIPLFCLSTFDTDYILVKESNKKAAIEVLAQQGITLVN